MLYQFDNLSLDPERRELRRGGQFVPVEPQVFDLLLYLIRNRERVVSKDDLIADVWRGRIVSESTLTSRIAAARQAIGDSGGEQRLIRTAARKGLRFVGDVREELRQGVPEQAVASSPAAKAESFAISPPATEPTGADTQRPARELPEKPSIVVLPFANLSGDPSQDYFADGMVEDITIALGRLPWLFVIGSIAAFTYKNRAVDVRQISAELGVRYVLRGSVRKEGNRVRITAQLTDAAHGGHLWADRVDGQLESVFEMQDRVAAQVSAAVAPALRTEEIERARRKPPENLTAYDLFLRALPHNTASLAHNQESLRLLRRAIELDPDYSAAYGLAAWCYFWQKMVGWVSPADPALAEGIRLAERAAELGTNDSEAQWMAAHALTLLAGEIDLSTRLADKALSLNPNSPNAWWARGVAAVYLGGAESDAGLEYHARAERLNPVDPWSCYYLQGMAASYFFAGRYEEAAAAADLPLGRQPSFPPALRLKAAACGLLGRIEEARRYAQRLLAVSPAITIAIMRAHYAAPLRRNPESLEKYLEGLRRSGLPEE